MCVPRAFSDRTLTEPPCAGALLTVLCQARKASVGGSAPGPSSHGRVERGGYRDPER